MPSQPNPNSPFLDTRLQADFGIHPPGTPTAAGLPTPQAGDVSFPAPPGAATAPVGRPPTPGQPAPTPATPAAVPTAPGGAPPASPPPTGAAPATPAPAAAPTAQPEPQAAVVPVPSATGETRFALSADGDARYREAIVQGRNALGPVPAVFRNPTLPQMPYELGKRNYNPFTGQYDG